MPAPGIGAAAFAALKQVANVSAFGAWMTVPSRPVLELDSIVELPETPVALQIERAGVAHRKSTPVIRTPRHRVDPIEVLTDIRRVGADERSPTWGSRRCSRAGACSAHLRQLAGRRLSVVPLSGLGPNGWEVRMQECLRWIQLRHRIRCARRALHDEIQVLIIDRPQPLIARRESVCAGATPPASLVPANRPRW